VLILPPIAFRYNGKQLPVRVYTTRGLKDQGKLALESAHQVVDYFSEVRVLGSLKCEIVTDNARRSLA